MLNKTPDLLAQRYPWLIQELEALRLPYTFEPEFLRDKINRAAGFQVRDNDHIAPRDGVTKIAEMLKAGASMPPVVLTGDWVLIDGNTRDEGHALAKRPRMSAVILDVVYETADVSTRRRLQILAGTLNAQNGEGLSPAEIHRTATVMIEENYNNTQIAKRLGIKESMIRALRQKFDARTRLVKLGLPPTMVDGAALKVLGTADALGLNNQPYRDVAKLAAEAGLTAEEVRDLVKEIKEAGSDTAAAEIITARRSDWEDRIHEHAFTGNGTKPPQSAQLRKALGYIIKFKDEPGRLVEATRTKMEEHLDLIEQSVAILSDVGQLQRQKL